MRQHLLLLLHLLILVVVRGDVRQERYLIVFVVNERSLGLYFQPGGFISGFTPSSLLDNKEGGGLRIGDRVAAVNDVEVGMHASTESISALFAATSPPFALTVNLNSSTSAARWSELETRSLNMVLEEEELRHEQDEASRINFESHPPDLAAMVIKKGGAVSLYISDGPLKMEEHGATAAVFGRVLEPGQCASKRLVFLPGAAQACSALAGPHESSFAKDAFLLVRRGGCSFQAKLMQAAQIGASGVIIANSEDLHFAAPADDSLRVNSSGASASLLAVMVSRSTGNRLAEVYDESTRSNLNPQVRLCSGIRAEAQKQNQVKRALPVLYKGLPRLDSATSLLDLEKHLFSDSGPSGAAVEAALRESRATQQQQEGLRRSEALLRALPNASLPYRLLAQAEAEAGVVQAVQAEIRLQHVSEHLVVFRFARPDLLQAAAPAVDLLLPEAGRFLVRLALLPHSGGSEFSLQHRRVDDAPVLALWIKGLEAAPPDSLVVSAAALDASLAMLLRAPAETGSAASGRAVVERLVRAKDKLRGDVALVRRSLSEAQEGHEQLVRVERRLELSSQRDLVAALVVSERAFLGLLSAALAVAEARAFEQADEETRAIPYLHRVLREVLSDPAAASAARVGEWSLEASRAEQLVAALAGSASDGYRGRETVYYTPLSSWLGAAAQEDSSHRGNNREEL